MKILRALLIIVISLSSHETLPAISSFKSSSKNEILEITTSKPINQKIRWKEVFKPIKIFKKKSSFWLLLFSGIGGSIALYFLMIREGEANAIDYGLVGILGLVALAIILILIIIPIIILIRIIKELKWQKRFKRCGWKNESTQKN